MAKKTVTTSFKGILQMNEGSIIEVSKDSEETYFFMDILKGLDGEEITLSIKHALPVDGSDTE